jgi:hypothetical protein
LPGCTSSWANKRLARIGAACSTLPLRKAIAFDIYEQLLVQKSDFESIGFTPVARERA